MADQNNTENVSVGKGVKGGYIFSAPLGTTLPTNVSTALPAAYVNLGFISEDGIGDNLDEDVSDFVDMNGDTILSETASYDRNFTFTLVETKVESLKEAFGESTVTESNGVIKVVEQSGMRTNRIYVIELALSGGRRGRIVIPNGKVSELGEITYASGEIIGYELTVKALATGDGTRTFRYYEQPAAATSNKG